MTVYIEYVIIDNFVLTYIIGSLSYRSLKVRASRVRNLISATVGTVCAVFFPLLKIGFWWLLGLRVVLLCVLCCILFYKKSKLPISLCVFLGITFLLGGAFFALGYVVYGDARAALTLPILDFPIGIILFLAGILYLLLRRLITKFHKNRDSRASIYRVEVAALGKTIQTQGFCDTGNRLFDAKSGLPVVIFGFDQTSQLLGTDLLVCLLDGSLEQSCKGARFIEYLPYGGRAQRLWLIKPDRFRLYFDEDKNIDIDVMLGLSLHSFGDTVHYGLIFGPAISAKVE